MVDLVADFQAEEASTKLSTSEIESSLRCFGARFAPGALGERGIAMTWINLQHLAVT